MKQLLTALLISFCLITNAQNKFGWGFAEYKGGSIIFNQDSTLWIQGDTANAIWSLKREIEMRDKFYLELWDVVEAGVAFYNNVPDYWKTKNNNPAYLKYISLLEKQGFHKETKGKAPKPSPIPDTTKPLTIKMQPRWRMLDGGLFILDSFFNDDAKNYWYYWNQAGSEDTVECVFIVSNTNDVNGICQYFDKNGYVVGGDYPGAVTYLDERKKPMPKNIIVWLSKEIK